MAPAGQILKDFSIARVNLVVGAHAIVQRLRQGQSLILVRDHKDSYDKNAVMVVAAVPPNKRKIGYLPPDLAKTIAPLLDAGVQVIARKAANPLYGVCQVAYIPPAPVEAYIPPAPVEAYIPPAPVRKPTTSRLAPVEEESVAEAEAETIQISEAPIKIVEVADRDRMDNHGVVGMGLRDESLGKIPAPRYDHAMVEDNEVEQQKDYSDDKPDTDETRRTR